ncbi:MAG: PRTRC system protein E [Tannerella sp.]|jgi:PRTRC genetic system protein E|nr:PRTRC system protein E [Tannerella sp.]
MFFTQIYQMMNQAVDITLVIRKKEGELMVSALPKNNGLKDEAQNHIVPLTLSGTPQEMDTGFMQAIRRPMQKATGLLTNMGQFEDQADKAAANSKMAKELKDKAAKEAKEKKEKFDKHMKKASEFEAGQKFSDALASLSQARAFATPQTIKGVDEKINALRMKMNQGSLFETEPAPAPQQRQQTQQDSRIHVVHPNRQPETVTGQQTVPQPMNGSVNTNGQQPLQQPLYGNGRNEGQSYGWQQQGPPQHYNTPPYNPQPAPEVFPEPELAVTADYSAYREGEYDQYPDFPGYANDTMDNLQNS